METNNESNDWEKRMHELEEKDTMYKLKRREKNELKSLHKRKSIIKLKEEEEKKKKEEEEKRKKEEERKLKEEEMRREMEREKERLKNKKKEILRKQLNYRESKQTKETVKEVLEDMCVLGSAMKEEIIEEKKKNPEKFISISEATKEENKNNGTFCLGVLAQSLESMGIETAIEKNASNDEETQNSQLILYCNLLQME